MSNYYSAPPNFSGAPPKKTNVGLIIAIVLGVMFVFALLCGGLLFALLYPAVQAANEAKRAMASQNNLKQISLAVLNYESTYRAFPPRYVTDPSGKPLYSWRVLLLPYMEQNSLYNDFHLDEPWDSPHNQQLLSRMPAVYSSPLDDTPSASETNYVVIDSPNAVLYANGSKMSEITDGTSRTILAIEVFDSGVPWTAPTDFTPSKAVQAKNECPKPAFGAAMCDGSVVRLSPDLDDEQYKAALAKNDGQAPMLE